jgi:hypothetical protein
LAAWSTTALACLQQSSQAACCAVLPSHRFIPADVDHLREDLEELRKLFFKAKVPMQVRYEYLEAINVCVAVMSTR